MRIIIATIILLFACIGLYGQDDKVRLAYQYYQEKDFQKAAVLFEELYEKTNSQAYFSYAVTCMLETNDFQQAERLIKKQLRRNKTDMLTYIEYGYFYKKQGNDTEAAKQYDHVLKSLPNERNAIIRIANAFIGKREFEYAQQTYQKGAKLINYGFHLELSNVYAYQRKSLEMVEILLDFLQYDPSQAEIVQVNLQARMNSNYDLNLHDLLRRSLLRRIQKDPKELIYSEMLLWYFIQQNDYTNAVIQAKALDKRLNEGGMRLIELGGIAKTNLRFQEAIAAYEYVLSIGKNSSFYYDAKFGYLDVFSEQIELGEIKDKNEFLKVEKMYMESIEEFAQHPESIRLIKGLAHLQAFYLDKIEDAKKILQEAIQNFKMNTLIKGACKIELGDIYLLSGQVSDAILEYAQAAKLNDDNEVGDKAKLKRATLAFYTGNFSWAQAQLDVLKAGTSKLIANDAFVLSMLISDNSGMDSTENALNYFARAEMFLQQKKQDQALKLLDTLEIKYKTHSLIDDVLFLRSKIYEKQGKTEKAIETLKQIAENYAHDLLGDDAIYKLAQIYDYQLNDTKMAMDYYKQIIFEYPGSIFVVEARKRFRILKGDNI
jgi:tetratricopeptide (TPR) repeat protein